MGFDSHGDHAEDNEANDHGALDIVCYEGNAETAKGGVDSSDGTFDYYCGETVEPSQGLDDLLESRKFSYHVEEQRSKPKEVFSLVLATRGSQTEYERQET